MSPAEVFLSPVGCDNTQLSDGMQQGFWLIRSLFTAISRLDEAETNARQGLAFLGEQLVLAIETKHAEMQSRAKAVRS